MLKYFSFRLREGWLMVGLLALMLFSVTWAVQRAGWADGLFILTPVTLLGMFTGIALAKIRGVPRLLLHLTGLMTGAVLVIWESASLLENANLLTIQDRVQDLYGRMGVWVETINSGGMSDDLPLFIFALAVLSWLLAYSSAWFIFRSRWLWWALIPNGIALLINISYASGSLALYFVLFMFSALLLMVRFNVLQHEDRWDRERVNYSPNLSWSFLWVSGLVASVIAGLMFLVPPQAVNSTLNNAWQNVNGPWMQLQLQWSRAFANVSGGGNFGYSAFNPSFALGGALNLGDTIALKVKSTKPLYWAARAYDNWTGFGWTDTSEHTVPPGSNIAPRTPLSAGEQIASTDNFRQPITVTVQIVQPKENVMFVPSRVESSSQASNVSVSWQTLDPNAVYTVPGSNYNDAPVQIRSLLFLLDQARTQALQPANADAPDPTATLALPGGDPAQAVQQFLAHTDQGPAIQSLSDQLRRNGVTVSYGLGDNGTINVSARGVVPNYDDVMGLQSADRLNSGDQYTVESLVTNADATSLRAASTDYAVWLRQRYLELPDKLPQRVKDKAEQVVNDAGATNAYDMAMAIQDYLRSPEFTYDTHIDIPPSGVDRVDYFLFTSKTGYCEYYASAMAVMLRSLGVPTRVMAGYAPGDYSSATGEYTVKESSSHLWPQVYFPGYGWVEFEPTPSQVAIERPVSQEAENVTPTATAVARATQDTGLDDDPTPTPPVHAVPATTDQGGGDNGGFNLFTPWTVVIVAALALVGYLLYTRTGERRRLAALNLSASQYYERFLRLAWWLGLRPGQHETPFEFANEVSQEVPGTAQFIQPITDAYVRERWGRRELSNEDKAVLFMSWQELRARMLRRVSQVRRMMQRGE